MTYYNTLIAEKLKAISEIKRINSLIDTSKIAGDDFSDLLQKLDILKVELERLNALILAFQLNQDNQPSISTVDSPGQGSLNTFVTPVKNDRIDGNPGDKDIISTAGLPE